MPITVDMKRILESAGGEQAVELRLRRFEEDVRFLQSLRGELLRKYLNEWIAVFEKSVVAQGRTIAELRKQLSAKHIPENEAVIEFIAKERKAMLL